jgi:hypothetical protein
MVADQSTNALYDPWTTQRPAWAGIKSTIRSWRKCGKKLLENGASITYSPCWPC